jgi:hypothetical protein
VHALVAYNRPLEWTGHLYAPSLVECALPATQGQRWAYPGCGMAQPNNSGTMELISTLEEIEAAVQRLPPAKRAEFRAWFLSFDASDWDRQMEDDMSTGTLDWLANEAISDSLSGRCSEL